MRKSLNFVIVGAQKAGTSFLHNCLMDHPDLSMPDEELVIFENPYYSDKSLKDLEMKLSSCGSGSLKGIKRPSYLAKEEAAKLIYDYSKNTRIIMILRNPVERAYSAYFHLMKMGLSPIIDPKKGLSKILKDGELKGYPRTKEILPFGLYSQHVERYLKLFPKKNVKIMFYYELKRNKKSFIASVYNFLGVDSTFAPESINIRPQKSIYSIPRLKFKSFYLPLLYCYDKNRLTLTPRKQNTFTSALISVFKEFDRVVLKKIFNRENKYISKPLYDKLYEYYKEDILRLEKLLSKNLEIWKVRS